MSDLIDASQSQGRSALAASPTRRAWHRFRRNRLGFWSLLIFCTLVVLSLAAELVSNDRPLLVRYEGQFYSPLIKTYPEKVFGGDFDTATDYHDPFIRQKLSEGNNWALFAPNPYGPKTINYFALEPNPSRPTLQNFLGTDDRGRDLLAQLIYGFRVSVLFALALTASTEGKGPEKEEGSRGSQPLPTQGQLPPRFLPATSILFIPGGWDPGHTMRVMWSPSGKKLELIQGRFEQVMPL